MKRLTVVLLFCTVALLAWPVESNACECQQTTTLIAGQHDEIGEVAVSCDQGLATVTYTVDPGWCLAATHLFVGDTLPKKSAPGQLGHQQVHGCTQDYTYEIPVDDCNDLKIAAHAEVLAWSLPIGGTIQYSVQFPSTDSYFDAWVTYDGMTDYFRAFCVDLAHTISSNHDYPATLFSTLDPDAPVDKPENLDIANFILNKQDHYADLCGAGWREVQGAFWKLLDDGYSCNATGQCSLGSISFDVGKVNCMIADAMSNDAEGFVPGPDDIIGILVYVPGTQFTMFQITMIEAYLGEETAWGEGVSWGKGWAMYFECD
jgi:hypothetical protein